MFMLTSSWLEGSQFYTNSRFYNTVLQIQRLFVTLHKKKSLLSCTHRDLLPRLPYIPVRMQIYISVYYFSRGGYSPIAAVRYVPLRFAKFIHFHEWRSEFETHFHEDVGGYNVTFNHICLFIWTLSTKMSYRGNCMPKSLQTYSYRPSFTKIRPTFMKDRPSFMKFHHEKPTVMSGTYPSLCESRTPGLFLLAELVSRKRVNNRK